MRFTRWDQKAKSGETDDFCYALSDLCLSRIQDKTLQTELSRLVESRDLAAIVDYEVKYDLYTPYDCAQARQILALFQKRADLDYPGGPSKELTAIHSFVAAEALCRETNHLFRLVHQNKFSFLSGVESRLFAAQRKIAQILGDVPSLSEVQLRFGPGATTQIPKRIASARRKLGTTHACSEDLLPVVRDVLEEMQGWIPFQEDSETCRVAVEVHHGKLVFVPKSLKTHRSVVVEPSLNSMVQCGVGDYMAERLRLYGVNIRDQAPNQQMALRGSLSGDLATLDLSSASDTIAIELIYALLPVDWALFLSNYRTGKIEYEGYPVTLEKFSSMGNGFTFPLETLIFYTLALSCARKGDEHLVRAYGDDIIIPTYAYADLCKLLHCVGFIPNLKKSFVDGPFRESCGADYHTGFNIRPVYVKDCLLGSDLFRLHNFFVQALDEELARFCLSYIDPSLQKWGPAGYGDGHLIGRWNPVPIHRDRGYGGYIFETFTYLSKRDFTVTGGERVLPSYTVYLGERKNDPVFPASRITNLWLLRTVARDLARRTLSDSSNIFHGKEGRFGVSIPGTRGCKLIKIYTFSTA